MEHSVGLTLVGGPTVVIEYAGQRLLTDPTFDPPGNYGNLTKLAGPALDPQDLWPLDAVLLSHDEHDDNLDMAGRAILPQVQQVLTTPSGAQRLGRARGLEPWESTELLGGGENVTVTAVPAQHGPDDVAPHLGEVTGFVLESPGSPTVYISGDNSEVGVAATVAERFPDVAIALVFAGGAGIERLGNVLLTVDAERVASIGDLWPDAAVVPVHIEDWEHFRQPRQDLIAWFADHHQEERLTLVERGERIEIP
ncbi:MBL fold metallo-hydrolase [Demequina sediminicola]|uniref:MBL fold metallo-hydrolase n=1 Tax=Demequina sediminicola TaxID=1095026 RepID=UPI000780B1C7|nr:MBL fold metallo-hydrolase [Demequina sediminicola]